ncbi:hypothetical protein GGTG_06755 [Gaeumannomyces tritici R3-111a-1]|uniref:Amidoligase enzyme n=1 Tax=Gaeumannomyces tritici (strain R3-111a-1) TaxID=644352 RepID=J3NZQ8_GAET3|nr:hypothetical protein GGTG_06755 [Gaeumannomyces tritici R3-111a-1]EJT76841.1 hypothetical protein GGTG_06755 [Gaeumannomyces tritici R3-111a-1]
MASSRLFYFGVEIELLMGSKKSKHSTWKSLASEVAKKLAKAGIDNHINESGDKSPDVYTKWSIAPEVTIPGQPAKGLYGLELVSPVYPSDWTWAADLDVIFSVLHSSFTVVESGNCSTHVHVSTYPPLEADELATLGKAILYFEPALDALVPKGRRGSTAYWCQSNRANPVLKGRRTLAECFVAVDEAVAAAAMAAMTLSSSPSSSSDGGSSNSGGDAGREAVVAALNMFPASSAYGRAHRKKHDFVRGKVYKWDLTGLCSARGTVEFRQPPGSLSAGQAVGWVSLALSFVEGSLRGDTPWFLDGDGADFEDGAPVERLWEVLCDGAEGLGLGVAGISDVFATRK